MPRILIVTGEASGDLHGGNLATALRLLRPDVQILGAGGPKMKAAGVELIPGIERLDVVGMVGWKQLRAAWRNYVILKRLLNQSRFDAVVFIDHPGLNLHLATMAKRAGQRVVYYIAPQIWAWRPGRIRRIKRAVDRMLVILPFEATLYRQAGVPCEFVGHPLLDAVASSYDRAELRKRFELDPDALVIGLLPGSRASEVRDLFPLMLGAAERLSSLHAGAQFVVAQASSIKEGLLDALSAGCGTKIRVFRDQASEVIAASDLLLVASGTATLQGAVIGTPMVITYRTSWMSYWLARLLIRVNWIGLVNIVAGRGIVTELIQHEATAERLSEAAHRLLSDEAALSGMRAAFRAVRDSLGSPGASRRAAEAVLKECRA